MAIYIIDVDPRHSVALIKDLNIEGSLFLSSVIAGDRLIDLRLPDTTGYFQAYICAGLKIVIVRPAAGTQVNAYNYKGRLIWGIAWKDYSSDPASWFSFDQERSLLCVSSASRVAVVDVRTGKVLSHTAGYAIHWCQDGTIYVLYPHWLLRSAGPATSPRTFERLLRIDCYGLAHMVSAGDYMLLNGISECFIVNLLTISLTPVKHEQVRNWQRPKPAPELGGFITIGLIRQRGFRFLLIECDGNVRTGQSVPDSPLAEIVTHSSGTFAVLQTGKLWKLSEIVWEKAKTKSKPRRI
jgi:hypothetical protein